MGIIYSVVSLAGLGLLFGIMITFASKKFEVEQDDRVEKIVEVLPNANCGGCGYAGCGAYAKAVVEGNAAPDLCSAGGAEVASKIGEILGVEIEDKEPVTAYVMCCGIAENTAPKYQYDGIDNCIAAARVSGGYKGCSFACLGFGNCVDACKFNAISIQNGIADVDTEKCVGCGMCVKACPKGLVHLVPKSAKYVVKCSSKDKGVDTKNNCKGGCIGCKICEKNCPSQAIKVVDNVAVIDYSKCTSCGICAQKCPRKIIKEKI